MGSGTDSPQRFKVTITETLRPLNELPPPYGDRNKPYFAYMLLVQQGYMDYLGAFPTLFVFNSLSDEVAEQALNRLLAMTRLLPPETEFSILLDFLVEFAGGLELAEHRMSETLVEPAAISYMAYAETVKRIKRRLIELYEKRDKRNINSPTNVR